MAQFDYDEIVLERKEKFPEAKTISKATVLAKNSKGLYLDLDRAFEGYIVSSELGQKSLEEYQIGDKLDVYVCGGQNQDGIFRLSVREIENEKNWHELEALKEQNLELKISKIVKSGVEVEIPVTKQTGFIPNRYLDTTHSILKDKKQSDWIGLNIPGKIHELDKEKNKIILNNKVISDEQRAAKAKETLTQLSIGQTITGQIVRCTDFGVFVDIGGVDALVPASELAWRRFKKPADVVNVGDTITAKVFRVDVEDQKVGLSIKQATPDPWTELNDKFKIGARVKGKVVTKADFGVFVEVCSGVEALLHKTTFKDGKEPEIGEEIEAEILNIDTQKRRMGITNNFSSETKTETPEAEPQAESTENKSETEETAKAEEETKNSDNNGKELEYAS